MCWWSMTWPMPISSTMAGKRRQSCRCRVHAMWRSSSLRCRKATTWRAGVSALWLATKRWSARWHVLKAITITAPLRRCRWQRLRRWRAINSACATLPNSTNAAVMYWLKGCMKRAGWSKCRRLRCMSGRKSRNRMLPWARWNLPRNCLTKRRSVSLRGLALATTATRMCALH